MIRILFFCFSAILSFGQNLPSNRSVDWTVAGLRDTSTIGFTYFNVEKEGAVTDGTTSVNDVINKLLRQNHPNGIHLHFPSGKYFFDKIITLPSNCLITGEGASKTKFIFNLNGSGHAIQSSGFEVNVDTSSLITTGIKGNNFLVVSDASTFEAGNWIRIQQVDEDLVFSDWAIGSVGQIIKIVAVSSDTLKLASVLRLDYPITRFPKVKKVQMNRNIGLQCFSIERMDNTSPMQTSNIHFSFAENCWISGIESNKTNFGHIELESVSNTKVEKSYFYDAFEYGGGGRAYGIVLHFTTNECLIENNVLRHLRHSILLQAGANGNVAAFNRSIDPFWTNANPLLAPNSAGELVLHGNYVYANLFEHNDVNNIVIDNSHGGNGPFNTFLRNRAALYGIFFSDFSSPSQNIIANEITNSGLLYWGINYTILGSSHFTYGNNNKGFVAPPGTANVTDISYHYLAKPEFVQDSQWGKIGFPSAMNTSSIPATDRFEANDIFAGACGNKDFYSAVIDLQQSNELFVLPNPAYDEICIKGLIDIVEYSIFDIQGRCLLQGQINNNDRIALNALSGGFYIIKIANRLTRFIKA